MAGRSRARYCVITRSRQRDGHGRGRALRGRRSPDRGCRRRRRRGGEGRGHRRRPRCAGRRLGRGVGRGFVYSRGRALGGIDVLYNNAGISPAADASVLEQDLEASERVQAVNTRGVYLCCKHGIPHLLERGGGSVINVASFVALVGAATSQILVHGVEGRRPLAEQGARRPVRAAGDPGQRALPRPRRDTAAAPDLGRDAGRGRAAARPPADGTDGAATRDRQRGPVPRERRVELRERSDVRRGRRPQRRLRDARVAI